MLDPPVTPEAGVARGRAELELTCLEDPGYPELEIIVTHRDQVPYSRGRNVVHMQIRRTYPRISSQSWVYLKVIYRFLSP